ncbi:hypothetical protein ACIRYZ_05860 [Kitasatospora sp. NPDC101155]|uniref:hypothetical protein n=1 Tax=Kitasatospora sp. NPDC101155 TaxID=3364097 RepID=UPI0038228380
MTERRYEYAPAGTLPGLLQRGRGLGARMAAEDPSSAAELVYGCIRWEWRWDRKVDGAAGLPEAYQESLWDCEANARLLAVEHAPDRPYTLSRVAELRDDPMEKPEIRKAAEARLAS